MNKAILRIIILSAVAAAILGGGLWLLCRTLGDREAQYQGRPLIYWILQAQGGQANAVLNDEIIPQLTGVMLRDTNDSRLRLVLVEKLNSLPGIFIHYSPAAMRRGQAARDLGEFGPAAKAAVPALLTALNSPDDAVRGDAAVALGKIHGNPEVVLPVLIKCLDDENVNAEAAFALSYYGEQARDAVPKLIPMLRIKSRDVFTSVVRALRAIDPPACAKALADLHQGGAITAKPGN